MLPIKTNNIDLCDLDFLIITSWSKKKTFPGVLQKVLSNSTTKILNHKEYMTKANFVIP